MKFSLLKDRRLGVSDGKRGYDIPLNAGAGSRFMILLVALMSFLALMALAGTFALSGLTDRWSSGLENRVTIEIPATKADGSIRKSEEIAELRAAVEGLLKRAPNIKTYSAMSEQEVQDLVTPWLGKQVDFNELPLPGLVSAEMQIADEEQNKKLDAALKALSPDIAIDAHESWLADILRLARSLKLSAGLVTLVISATTIIAIAGAIRSRMAEHKDDVELLHLMGASDEYITKQFQLHAIILAFKGSLIGLLMGAAALGLMMLIASSSSTGLLPSFSLSLGQNIVLLCMPVFVAGVAWITARFTVHHVLSLMP